jgi:hypothetical protein
MLDSTTFGAQGREVGGEQALLRRGQSHKKRKFNLSWLFSPKVREHRFCLPLEET